MNSEIFAHVQRIAADVLRLPLERVTSQTSPQNVEHWDSVEHLNLTLALEQELGVKFQPEDIEQMNDIAAVVQLVELKLGSRR